MILNISGRTDIVNYYTKWLMRRFEEGFAYVRNPIYPSMVSKINLMPENIDAIVFCSKNYKPILKHIKYIDDKYRIFCHYTITAYGSDVELRVPPIDDSISTLIELSKMIGKHKIAWRYDPLLLTINYTVDDLIKTFEYIAQKIAPYISFCLFSFVEMYEKLKYNMPEIIPFTEQDKQKLTLNLGVIAKKYGLKIQTCGTDDLYTGYGIGKSGCITKTILENAHHVTYKEVAHKGTRPGCHCMPSRDLGAYETCISGCRYCYATKNHKDAIIKHKTHDPLSPFLFGNIEKEDTVTDAKIEKYITFDGKQISLFD